MCIQCVYNRSTMCIQWVFNVSTMELQWVYNCYTTWRNGERPTAKRRADSSDTACGQAKQDNRTRVRTRREGALAINAIQAGESARQASKQTRQSRQAGKYAGKNNSQPRSAFNGLFCCASVYAAPVSHITNAGSDDSSDDSSSGHFQHGGVACPAGNESVSACRTDSYPAGQGTPIAEDKAPVARPSSAESPNASRRSSASTCGNTILRHGSNM